MKIVVTGSRKWTDAISIDNILRIFLHVRLAHGAATGLDRIAAEIGGRYGFEVVSYPVTAADYLQYGRRAPLIRNIRMLENEKPDLVLAWPLPDSRGTLHCIYQARTRGFKTIISPTIEDIEKCLNSLKKN